MATVKNFVGGSSVDARVREEIFGPILDGAGAKAVVKVDEEGTA